MKGTIKYTELQTLEKDLGIPAKTLYSVSNALKKHYHTQYIPKKNGKMRKLTVPDFILKKIQRSIYDKLLVYMDVSSYASAYEFCRGIVYNARRHCGKKFILKLDIKNFFDSISYYMVKEKVFKEEIFSEQLRILLSMLCCCGECIPQGAPTSPKIANIVMCEFDREVGDWCRKRGISYTRYCDDMTFSSDCVIFGVEELVAEKLKKLHMTLNRRKTKRVGHGQRQTVTGLVVNNTPKVRREYIRSLEQELYYCKRFGTEEHLKRKNINTDTISYLRRLDGKISFVLNVDRNNNNHMLEWQKWVRAEISNS